MTADFDTLITKYLSNYLPCQIEVSENTISSYCTTFKLLLKYCREHENFPSKKIEMSVFTDDLIFRFLQWLETERGASNATINQRLFAIRSFFRYAQLETPQLFLNYSKILNMPKRKTTKPSVSYIDTESIKGILYAPNGASKSGRRDLTLLCVMYDTGARVSEIVNLSVRDVRLDNPAKIRLFGKGRKLRDVPILPKTTEMLKSYMHEHHLLKTEKYDEPLFFNRIGQRLTRAGVAYILQKYADGYRTVNDSQITPHILRHTKAMHLLQAGVSIVYIKDLLGHVNISTTEVYARADIEMKRKALEAADSISPSAVSQWQQDATLLTWLEEFGRTKR